MRENKNGVLPIHPVGITVKRRRRHHSLRASLGLDLIVDLADGLEFLGVGFWNLTLDLVFAFLLERDDELDRVEGIGNQIIDKGSLGGNLPLVHIELIDADLL